MRLKILGLLLACGFAPTSVHAQEAPETPPEPAAEAPSEPAATAAPAEKAPASLMEDTPETDASKTDARKPDSNGRVPILRRSPSLQGPTGLDEVWSADPGPQGTVRLRLSYGFFNVDDWPTKDSSDQFGSLDLALAWAPLEYLETFLSARSTSNVNKGGAPKLLQTQGDLTLGAKAGTFITEGIALGFAASARLLSGLGDGGFLGEGTSFEFRGLTTFDFLKSQNIPARLHLDISYTLENGEAVFADQPAEQSVIQEWGLQAYRYDRLMIGIGLEIPFSEYATPYIEYRIGTPFLVELTRRGEGTQEFDFASVPHSVAPGIKLYPTPALAFDLAVRLGFSDQTYTGVKATPPWMVVMGLSYTLDPRPEIIEREVAPVAPPAPAVELGTIAGRVLDALTGEPVQARIAYPGSGRSAQVTDDGGRFSGYRFKPGEVAVQITAEGYKRYSKKIQVGRDATTAVDVKLDLDPASAKGKIEVRVFDPKGKPMGAGVAIGEEGGDALADKAFVVDLKPGKYTLSVGTAGFKLDTREVEIIAGETLSLRVPLKRGKGSRPGGAKKSGKKSGKARSARPLSTGTRPAAKSAGGGLVRLRGSTLSLKRKVAFEGKSAKLTGASKKVLDDMAAVMKANPQLKRVRVSVHTDGQGERAALTTLSKQQGQSVKSYLVGKGVAGKRLGVKGFGPDKPLAPNMTERGRAKNRRVGFLVTEMGE